MQANKEAYCLTQSSEQNESERLSIQHGLWLMELEGKLFESPLKTIPRLVLDLGCGSGAWTIDMALAYPTTQVIGVDLTPPTTEISELPSNCRFVQADLEQPWTFIPADFKVDLIHARMLACGVKNWRKLLSRCYDQLKPGGWLELPDVKPGCLEITGTLCKESSPALRWMEAFRASATKTGIDVIASDNHAIRLKETGFINIKGRAIPWLVGGAGGSTEKTRKIGDIHLGVVHTLISGTTEHVLMPDPEVDPEAIHKLADQAKMDLRQNQKEGKFTMAMSLHTAQKPIRRI